MLVNYFYHNHIKNSVSVFGTLFNNIHIKQANGEDYKVPLAYGPRDKYLNRINQQPDLNSRKLAIKVPRISFEMTSLSYDSATALNKRSTVHKDIIDENNEPKRLSVRGPIPYKIGMQLSIMAKKQSDALQIVEQILPFFQPAHTVTIKDLQKYDLDIITDIPITLLGISSEDEYEGDYEQRKVLMYTLEFEMLVKLYAEVKELGVIKKTDAGLITDGTSTKINTEDLDDFLT